MKYYPTRKNNEVLIHDIPRSHNNSNCVYNNRASKYSKQKLMELKVGEIHN